MKEKKKTIPTIGMRIELAYDVWEKMDDIARLEKIPKTQMLREGANMWLDKYQAEKTA